MMKNLVLLSVIVLLIGCEDHLQSKVLDVTATAPVPAASPTEDKSAWAIYDPDPNHPWNRAFRQFFRRTTVDGAEYGADELDPLLWFNTTYLLTGDAHRQAVQVLDEFLSTHAEDLIHDTLKRAMFQRDMWAVFDWLASQSEPYPSERQALESRLAWVIQRVALSKDEILALPDNYVLTVRANVFPANFQVDDPGQVFLPSDLFQADSAWVPMGREGGPIAMAHISTFPFYGRSVFLVFLRSPHGRPATLDFIESLNTEPQPVTAIGSEVALVRRMLLIDQQAELVLSPLVETIQLRHFGPRQTFYEFELDRARLFDSDAGGLFPKTSFFMLFMSHGDVFEHHEPRATVPKVCKGCHLEQSPIPNSGSTKSILSYSRESFPLPDNKRPILFATTWADEARTVTEWKRKHETWKALEALWNQTSR